MMLEVNGMQYSGFLSAKASLRLDAISDVFSFEATSEEGVPLPIKVGDSCTVLVDGEKVITGFVEIVSIDGRVTNGQGEHQIQIEGRDKTGDLLDSSIGVLADIRAPITLKTICERVIAHLDIDGLLVVDEASPAPFTKAEDIAAPEPGQSAFDFLEGYARKRQVLLSSNGDGNVVITQSSGIETEGFIQNRIKDNTNNVIKYSASYDSTGRFNKYLISSQLNPVAGGLAGLLQPTEVVNQTSTTVDELIRVGRQLALIAEKSSSASAAKERATWEANIRRARGKVYGVTVDTYRDQGGLLWTPNTLVRIQDEFVDIDSRMLLNTVDYFLTPDEGTGSTLSFVDKDAYTLALAEPTAAPKKEKVGGDFIAEAIKAATDAATGE